MYDFAQYQDRQRALNCIQIRRNRRKEYVVQDANIKAMQQQLIAGTLDVPAFLSRACHTVGGLQKRMRKHHMSRRRDTFGDGDEEL